MTALDNSGRAAVPVWLPVLLPILLAAALTAPLLNVDAYNGDEPAHLLSAGILEPGPRSLAEVWDNSASRVAPGWPVLVAIWSRAAGWSEPAVRSLALFAGLLTIAMVYRAGREMFSPTAGLFAAALLAASVFHLAYMVRAGPYAGVALFTALVVWSYRKNAIFALAAMAAALQLRLIQRGLARTATEELGDRVLTVTGLLQRALMSISNGILDASMPAGEALAIGLMLVLAAAFLKHLRARRRGSDYRYPGYLAISFLALVIIVNEIFRVVVDNRIRYLMPLLPLCALLAGALLWRCLEQRRRMVLGFLALWLCLGSLLVSATPFRFELGYFFRADFHHVAALLEQHVDEEDGLVLLLDGEWDVAAAWRAQKGKLQLPFDIRFAWPADVMDKLSSARAAHPFVWLLGHRQQVALSLAETVEAGLQSCDSVPNAWGYRLERYPGSGSHCPT